MQFTTLLDHVLNFCLPAAWMAVAATLCGRWMLPPSRLGWPVRTACQFALGLTVLAAGWVIGGADGKMATWAALVAATALGECLLRLPRAA